MSTYGILYWLPSYSTYELGYNQFEIGGLILSYNIGVIIGNIVIGKIGDLLNGKRAIIWCWSLCLGIFALLYIVFFSHYSYYLMNLVIFFMGFFVESICNVISATAATDLAKDYHHSQTDSDHNDNAYPENHKSIATLSGILDGSGSFGAAIGSFAIGVIREYSWTGMFVFLTWAVFISSMVVLKPWIKEFIELIKEEKDEIQ